MKSHCRTGCDLPAHVRGAGCCVNFTAPVSKANAEARAEQARLDAVPDAASFQLVEAALPEEVAAPISRWTKPEAPRGAICLPSRARGFGGTIQVMCVIGTDGFDPRLPHDGCLVETTTLGGQTANESYTGQYTGRTPRFRRERHLPRNHHIECLSRLRGNCV